MWDLVLCKYLNGGPSAKHTRNSSPPVASLNGLSGLTSAQSKTFELPVTSPTEDPVSAKMALPKTYLPSPTRINRWLSEVQLRSLTAPLSKPLYYFLIGLVPKVSQIIIFPSMSPEQIIVPLFVNLTAVVYFICLVNTSHFLRSYLNSKFL